MDTRVCWQCEQVVSPVSEDTFLACPQCGVIQLDQVIAGDCLEVMKRIPNESVHFAVTSPPYNLGVGYDIYDDTRAYEEYLSWLEKVWLETKRVLVPGGRFALNVAPTSIKNFRPIHYDMARSITENVGLTMRTEILWYKQTMKKRTAWGSWKSPRNPHILPSWEYVLVFSKGSWRLHGDTEQADITKEEFMRFSDGFWYIPPASQRNGHPSPFPEELIYRLVKFYTYRGNIVLDMFGGTGTAALVASRTGRHYLHIDISEEYCATARRRLLAAEQLPLYEKPPVVSIKRIREATTPTYRQRRTRPKVESRHS